MRSLVTTGLSTMGPPKWFYIDKAIMADHYNIRSNDGTCVFYVSLLLHGLVLREGPDRKSPIVAVSSMPLLSRNATVGLGDPADGQAMCWEGMQKESFWSSRYHWAMAISVAEKSVARIDFVWSRVMPRSYTLQDAQTGEVFAAFTSDATFRTCGILQINKSYGRDFELMLFTTFITLCESVERRFRVIWECD